MAISVHKQNYSLLSTKKARKMDTLLSNTLKNYIDKIISVH